MQRSHNASRKRSYFYAFIICVCSLLTALAEQAAGQDLLKGADLSTVKVDHISDAEIVKLNQQMRANGVNMRQAEQMAISNGMSQLEFAKLKERLSRINSGFTTDTSGARSISSRGAGISQPDSGTYKTFAVRGDASVFGASLFSTPSLSFEPNLRISVPSGYLIGPDDELAVLVSGYQEANLRATVSPEGGIALPQVGIIQVAGLTFEEASKRIREKMTRTAYPNIASGLTQVSVTLAKFRSIRITVLGAVKPGNYTVSSLTSLFNSLYQSGGPGNINTFRNIELRRGNKEFRKIDLYDFLTRGDQSGNVLLKEGDVINIPVYNKRVRITGEVKRPGIFELRDNETLANLLYYAGGFTERAYTSLAKIKQVTDTERKIKDIPKSSFDTYIPGNGDEIDIAAVLERFENSVQIEGAVYRPGEFELTPELTIGGLIKRAGGLTDAAFMQRAIITRTMADQRKEVIPFDIQKIIQSPAEDIALRKYDVVTIASVTDFRDDYKVRIEGEVRKPGEYNYLENLTLKDLLFHAGGLTDAASSYRIEVARRINNDRVSPSQDTIALLFDTNIGRDMDIQQQSFRIQPFDIVVIRKRPGYVEQQRVTIRGEVLYPGMYTIQSKKERVSDLIRRAGGLTGFAYPDGASLMRNHAPNVQIVEDKIQKAVAIAKSIKDTSSNVVQDVRKVNAKIVVDMRQVMENPGSYEDYILEEGDEIDVPKFDPLVKISGEVYQSTKTNFQKNQSFGYYLSKAGGVTDNARLNKAYVLYPNGQVVRTHSFLFGLFRSYPEVASGSEIVIPKRVERRKMTAAETIGISSAFLSLVSLIIITISSLN